MSIFRRLCPRPGAPPAPPPTAPPHLGTALVAIAALHTEAQARGDVHAMRYYAQAVRCLLGPTRAFLSGEDDLAPQPEWPL